MFPALYAILDATPSLPPESTFSFAEKLAAAGVELIQLRAKNASTRHFHELSGALVSRFASHSVRVIVNDRPDIAAIAGAHGVHVGQEDLPVADARKICPPPQWVGVSTHNLEQLRAADLTSADYIAVGPIFPTATKENPDPVVGLEFLREARKITRKPLVAIGGITVQSASDVFRAGADSVAVIGDLANAPDPAQRAREYLAIAKQVSAMRSSNAR
ncbi:MAG: thiamine phosphate synthase [Candidatus Acidiferrales bacterium]